MNSLVTFARRGADSPINQWLNDNPLVLGGIMLAIGALLLGSGVYELRSGVTHDKRGNVIPGGMGKFTSILRIVCGLGVCGFGLYKLMAG